MTPIFEAHDDPDIDRVWTWFEYQTGLIGESRATVLRHLGSGFETADRTARPNEDQFIGLTRNEIEEFFDAQRGRLELLTMFEILATTEAVLRIEVKTRVAARNRDPLSRRFRTLHKAQGERILLDDHRLAHGRHWHPKLGRGYAPSDVFDISRALIDSIPQP